MSQGMVDDCQLGCDLSPGHRATLELGKVAPPTKDRNVEIGPFPHYELYTATREPLLLPLLPEGKFKYDRPRSRDLLGGEEGNGVEGDVLGACLLRLLAAGGHSRRQAGATLRLHTVPLRLKPQHLAQPQQAFENTMSLFGPRDCLLGVANYRWMPLGGHTTRPGFLSTLRVSRGVVSFKLQVWSSLYAAESAVSLALGR
jgi:hypothetical protein